MLLCHVLVIKLYKLTTLFLSNKSTQVKRAVTRDILQANFNKVCPIACMYLRSTGNDILVLWIGNVNPKNIYKCSRLV